ncbi:MAG: succinyl-diaminopimelate desuccinylase [Kosmotogales bacterium]|nr:succinyl-diaminopimelate desuccinylase [Kosmotogales bacterium]
MEKRIDEIVLTMREDIIKGVQRLVKIKSDEGEPEEGAPFGEGPLEALKEALKMGKELGFETKNVDNYAGHIQYGNSGELFGVLGHLDVVPAGIGWKHPPYNAEIEDGKIYGRGTADDKGPVVAALFALKAVKDSGIPIKNRVRLIMGTQEESGWGGILHYLNKEEEPEMSVSPDAGFPIINAEKGIVNYSFKSKIDDWKDGLKLKSLNCGEASNMVAMDSYATIENFSDEDLQIIKDFKPYNEAILDYEIKGKEIIIHFKGKSAHGSMPHLGISSLAAMVHLLASLNFSSDKLNLYFKTINEKLGYEMDGRSLGISGSDNTSGPLTVNSGTLKLKNNELEYVINIRYPIFFNEKMINSQIKEALKGIEVEGSNHKEPLYVSPDSDLIVLLREVYEEMTGLDSEPFSIGGGTYARAVKNAVAFGICFPDDEDIAHKPDEYVEIDKLMTSARIYAQLLYRVLK